MLRKYDISFKIQSQNQKYNGQPTAFIKWLYYSELMELYDTIERKGTDKYRLAKVYYNTVWFIIEYIQQSKQTKRHWSERCAYVISQYKSYGLDINELRDIIKKRPKNITDVFGNWYATESYWNHKISIEDIADKIEQQNLK